MIQFPYSRLVQCALLVVALVLWIVATAEPYWVQNLVTDYEGNAFRLHSGIWKQCVDGICNVYSSYSYELQREISFHSKMYTAQAFSTLSVLTVTSTIVANFGSVKIFRGLGLLSMFFMLTPIIIVGAFVKRSMADVPFGTSTEKTSFGLSFDLAIAANVLSSAVILSSFFIKARDSVFADFQYGQICTIRCISFRYITSVLKIVSCMAAIFLSVGLAFTQWRSVIFITDRSSANVDFGLFKFCVSGDYLSGYLNGCHSAQDLLVDDARIAKINIIQAFAIMATASSSFSCIVSFISNNRLIQQIMIILSCISCITALGVYDQYGRAIFDSFVFSENNVSIHGNDGLCFYFFLTGLCLSFVSLIASFVSPKIASNEEQSQSLLHSTV